MSTNSSIIGASSASAQSSTRVMAAAAKSVPSDQEIADFMGFSTSSAVSPFARSLLTQERLPVQFNLNERTIRELSSEAPLEDSLIAPSWAVDSFSQLPSELQSIATNYLSVDDCSAKVKEFIQIRHQLSRFDPRASLVQALIKSNKEYQLYCKTLKQQFFSFQAAQTTPKNPCESILSSADSLRQALRKWGVSEQRFSQKNSLAELKAYLQGAFRDEEPSIFKQLAVAIVFNDTDRVAMYFRQHQPSARLELIEVMKELLGDAVEEYLIDQAFTLNLSLLSEPVLPEIPRGPVVFSLPCEEPLRTKLQEMARKTGLPMPPADASMLFFTPPIIPPTLPPQRMTILNEQEIESCISKFDAFYKRTDSLQSFRIEMGASIVVYDFKDFIDALKNPSSNAEGKFRAAADLSPEDFAQLEAYESAMFSNEDDKKKCSAYFGIVTALACHVMLSFLSRIEQLESTFNIDFSRLLAAENANAKKVMEEIKEWLLSFKRKTSEDFYDVSLKNYARFVLHEELFEALCKKYFHDGLELMATAYPSAPCTPQLVVKCCMQELERATQSNFKNISSDIELAVDRLFQKERCINQIMKRITNIWNDTTIADDDKRGHVWKYYASIDLWGLRSAYVFDYNRSYDVPADESLEANRRWLSQLEPADLVPAYERMACKTIQERKMPTLTTWVSLLVDMNIFR